MNPNDALRLIRDYIKRIDARYQRGNATEHTYRDDLRVLLEDLLGKTFTVTNEPKRTECGAPDYVITKQNLPIAYIEAKDVGKLDFKDRGIKEQLARYQEGLPTLVATDYLEFHLFIGGEPRDSVRIGQVGPKGIIVSAEEELARFLSLIITSIEGGKPETITSPKRLALRMAGATRLLANAITKSLEATKTTNSTNPMLHLKEDLRKSLKLDLKNEEFADLYAQTIAYGLFIARYHDNTGTFSLDRATNLLQGSSDLLHLLFSEIKTNRTDSVRWIIDQLAQLLAHTDTHAILRAYQLEKGESDPTVHLYEDLLAAYDADKRKKLGVYYTPLPIVRFMVRSVHHLLQDTFNLPAGLADTATLPDGHHQLHILDPATGTGTFLAEVVRLVHNYRSHHEGLGDWPTYVEKHLLPRLHGFEIMMAPYAIANLKLGLQLRESGYEPQAESRIGIYLINSLEEGAGEGGRFWLADEAMHARRIQRETPVMVLLGNPPYNVRSKNRGKSMLALLEDYKREPGDKPTAKREERRRLDERNPKSLNDDYVKFIRLAQSYVERNPNGGIVAFITPHSFLDAPTLRGMRWHLLQTFDRIYTIDLHGNQLKGETKRGDENVFAIQTGVAITLFVRTNPQKQGLGKVYHHELWGSQHEKFKWLDDQMLGGIEWQKLSPRAPYYLFVPRDETHTGEYRKGFAINDLYSLYSVGVVTSNDSFAVCDSREEIEERIHDLITMDDATLQAKYPNANLKPTSDWATGQARNDVGKQLNPDLIRPYAYRPFDNRWIYYTGKSAGIAGRPRYETFSNFLLPNHSNLSLLIPQQTNSSAYHHAFCTRLISDLATGSGASREGTYAFPLYVLERATIAESKNPSLIPNFREKVYRGICERLGEEVEPQSLFDYIYATLHCPSYRERYAEQLRIGFPRIPYPTDRKAFLRLANLGGKLRGLHLMEGSERWQTGVRFDGRGDGRASDYHWEEADATGRVYINATQYFSPIPRAVWDFQVGSYQPMQKWLKDRKGKPIDTDHYRQMAHAIRETLALMAEIDTVWEPPE